MCTRHGWQTCKDTTVAWQFKDLRSVADFCGNGAVRTWSIWRNKCEWRMDHLLWGRSGRHRHTQAHKVCSLMVNLLKILPFFSASCYAFECYPAYPRLAVVTPPTCKNSCRLYDCMPKGCNSLSGSVIKESFKTHQIGPHRGKVDRRSLLLNQTVRLWVSIFRFHSF